MLYLVFQENPKINNSKLPNSGTMGRVDFGTKIYNVKTALDRKNIGQPIIEIRSERNSKFLNQSESV